MKQSNSKSITLTKRTFILLMALYLLICVLLLFLQDRLIFSLAYRGSQEVLCENFPVDTVKPLEISMSDGCVLRGYWMQSTTSKPKKLLFYFGANAEDISLLPPKMTGFSDWSIVLMHYRGYLTSDGEPSAEKLYADSQEIYDYILKNSDINYEKIVIMGRSIGSSVATHLASTRENSAVILISPFDSLIHVISQKCPILPVNLLLKHKFESIKYAPDVTSPVYILAGINDWLVPTSLTKELAKSFGGEVTYTEIPDVDHNSIDDCQEYWLLISDFLAQ